MESNSYHFTAIRGVQAGMAYYVIMCPLKLVPRLFRFDDELVPAEQRAQRVLNQARVPVITRYIVDHPDEYILSSLCACVDGDMEFQASASEGPLKSVGELRIGMSATILMNDGQHRRAAIEEAVKERQALGDESISVVVFADRGLVRSQQMFADLNVHAIRPTKSLRLLYNHRDTLSLLVRNLIRDIPLFRDFTDVEKTSISNRSMKLFTLSSLHQATEQFLGKPRGAEYTDNDELLARRFWEAVIACMPDWSNAQRRLVPTHELRRDYIHAHGVALQAIGMAGARLIISVPNEWEERLKALGNIDWSRSNQAQWQGRALLGGKVNKSKQNVVLTSNVIVRAFGLEPTPDAEVIERSVFRAKPQEKRLRAVNTGGTK